MKSASALLILIVFLLPRVSTPQKGAVASIPGGRLQISTPSGSGQLVLFADADLSAPQPGTTRAIVVFHGLHRNAAGYAKDVEEARDRAGSAGKGTLLVAPQFLDEEDARAYKLPYNVLRWDHNQWEGGETAASPAPISSYAVIDAIIARLADRVVFPNLREIVLAGHSGGGQVVQRYAVTGRQIAAVEKPGIALRYVVANPSSYVYFDDFRPAPAAARGCKEFNKWKFGFRAAPAYVGSRSSAELETAYVARSVVYLLGTEDDDPNGPDIDKSCPAEAQGATRLQRGTNYFKYLRSRHSTGLTHRVLLVSGVAHNARKMFTSPCGIDALFQTGACKEATIE